MVRLDDAGRTQVDEKLETWRQGDCVIGEHWFLFRIDTEHPLTSAGAPAATEGAENVETVVRGFAVVTQTWDLVRRSIDRPSASAHPSPLWPSPGSRDGA